MKNREKQCVLPTVEIRRRPDGVHALRYAELLLDIKLLEGNMRNWVQQILGEG